MSKFPSLTKSYRLYAASDNSLSVLHDLERHYSPHLVVKRFHHNQDLWYVLDVDDEFLKRLKERAKAQPDITLASALDLHEPMAAPVHILKAGERVARAMAAPLGSAAPHVVVDQGGSAVGVRTRAALPQQGASMYPHLDGPAEVDVDAIAEFVLRLDSLAQAGTAAMLNVAFPEGAATLDINVVVSSSEFSPPAGESWSAKFVLDRALQTNPSEWVFKARALTERPQYSLTVSFNAAGNALGAITYTALLKGTAQPDRAARQSGGLLSIPDSTGAQVVICIAEQPSDTYEITIYQGGQRVAKPMSWRMSGDQYTGMMEAAKNLSDLIELGSAICVDLPPRLLQFLNRKDLQGATTLFMSDSRVAPFEVLQIRPKENGPLLGVDRPVVRWLSESAMPPTQLVNGAKIACIRPNYKGEDALPSAALEEGELKKRFPNMCVARTIAEVDQMLSCVDIHVVHFAGHAESERPRFMVEDGPVFATRFHPSRPLMKEAQPLFFVNGCRAGQARGGAPAFVANFAKVLLRNGAGGFIAPMIAINSPAALLAEKTFYDALRTETVAEAVRCVRELSRSCPDDQKATVSSYVAFVPPTMRIHIQARRASIRRLPRVPR